MSPVRPEVTIVGRRAGAADQRLRDFLTRIAQPFRWLDADGAEAAGALEAAGLTQPAFPVVIEDVGVIEDASVERVAERWHATAPPTRERYDLAIAGAGPAGLAAAVYSASDGLSTLVVEEDVPGGQASHTSLIENFFGFPEGIGGAELARLAGRQAERFGAELSFLRAITGSRQTPAGEFELEVAGGHTLSSRAVIAAPGMEWRRLEAPGVEDLLGRGVLYGAGRSEAAHCSGDDVIVVGAGNSAGQAALDLGDAGARVTMLVRGDTLARSMSAYLVERIANHPLVEVRLRTVVTSAEEADGWLGAVHATASDGGSARLEPRMMFLCLGGVPRTGWCEAMGVSVDAAGFIRTGPDLLEGGRRPSDWPLPRDPLALETSVPGLFAAGDVRHGSTKRVAGAVGEGAMAAALVHHRLEELNGLG